MPESLKVDRTTALPTFLDLFCDAMPNPPYSRFHKSFPNLCNRWQRSVGGRSLRLDEGGESTASYSCVDHTSTPQSEEGDVVGDTWGILQRTRAGSTLLREAPSTRYETCNQDSHAHVHILSYVRGEEGKQWHHPLCRKEADKAAGHDPGQLCHSPRRVGWIAL
jgi:hypothetical protein